MDKLHNVDVDRIKQLAKTQGLTLTYLSNFYLVSFHSHLYLTTVLNFCLLVN